jgi:hypothetical protein
VERLERMKRGGGIKDLDDKSKGMEILMSEAFAKINIQKWRSVALGSREDVPTPQKGQTGPLDHPRLGFVGRIVYWSLGNCALVVKIIVELIRNLNLTESVSETLTPIATKSETETNARIVMLMRSSSISIITGVRIIGAHVSTIKTLFSSSSAGSTEWWRMCQD